MKLYFVRTVVLFFFLISWAVPALFAASPTAASLATAKQQAESMGYIFLTSHDEIVAMAKKESKMRALRGCEKIAKSM